MVLGCSISVLPLGALAGFPPHAPVPWALGNRACPRRALGLGDWLQAAGLRTPSEFEADRRAEHRERDEHAFQDDRGFRCQEPVRGAGTEWIGQDGALKAARKDWMERVRYDHGERFIDMTNDREEVSRCSRVSIGEVAGQVMCRCEIAARPMKQAAKASARSLCIGSPREKNAPALAWTGAVSSTKRGLRWEGARKIGATSPRPGGLRLCRSAIVPVIHRLVYETTAMLPGVVIQQRRTTRPRAPR